MSNWYIGKDESKAISHHGIKGQQWGIRNGPPYPLSSDKLADQVYNLAKKNEKQVTKDISSAAMLSKSKLYGLTFRLKTKESIQRKIETDATQKGITEFEAAKAIKDGLRYSTVTSDDQYVTAYNAFKSTLKFKGYREVSCKNYFKRYKEGTANHKQITSVFSTPKGYLFEVQFQTPSSITAKEAKTPLYERARRVDISAGELEQLKK